MLPRSQKILYILKRILNPLNMIDRISVIDFLQKIFVLQLLPDFRRRDVLVVGVFFYQENEKLKFVGHVTLPSHKLNCAGLL